jgi:hypothetical protein
VLGESLCPALCLLGGGNCIQAFVLPDILCPLYSGSNPFQTCDPSQWARIALSFRDKQ